ncbi:GntR family transcriptional regulator [Pseudalkalibacillus decolorationis]|uniref:GntR family transcriptional regulator n=1 Tax=Pseudalkalibacillus decolorationis TaxID=163879 RepID=UPI00214900E8|nr:GntR family transcriptional regulator [Pseudalkalibacillus decolorationis]
MNEIFSEKELNPFYKQLKDKILDDIENGKLRHGDKLPSERELAEQYGISRMTARHTLSILEREGIVNRRVGAGTFISNHKIEMDFITFDSFTNTMLGRGLIPSTRVLSVRKILAKPNLANKLKVPSGEEMIAIKRLRMANEKPIAIEESFIPVKFCPNIENLITDSISLYQILEEEYGIVLVKAKQYMHVMFSEESDSKLLGIRSDSACIFQEAVAFDREERELEFSTSITRSDIVKFYTELNLK